jgi:hypothetical protein
VDVTITVTVPADQVDAVVAKLVDAILAAAPGLVDAINPTPLVDAPAPSPVVPFGSAAGYDPDHEPIDPFAPPSPANPIAGSPAVTSTKVEQTDTTSQTEGAAPDSSSTVTATTEHTAAKPVRDPRTGHMVDG